MTTTTTKYKKGKKKGKAKKKKKISAVLPDLHYKINYTTSIQRRMTYLHNVRYISFLTIILPTNLTLECVDLLFFTVVLPGVTYNVTF